MTTNGAPLPVEAPPRRPPSTSLLATLRALGLVTDYAEDRFGNGVSSDAGACPAASGEDPCAASAVIPADCADGGALEAQPWVARSCVSRTTLDRNVDLEAKARAMLEVCQHEVLASEFWRGELTRANVWGNPYLTDPASTEIAQNLSVVDGLARMEDALAECSCGARSAIHASPWVVALWSSLGLIRRDAGLILTVQDTVVITGPGYDGSGPSPDGIADGPAATTTSSWIYGTLLPDAHVGPVDTQSGYDEDTNDHVECANRLVVARFDACCLFTAEVDPTNVCGA